jgi:hypothetical protein
LVTSIWFASFSSSGNFTRGSSFYAEKRRTGALAHHGYQDATQDIGE